MRNLQVYGVLVHLTKKYIFLVEASTLEELEVKFWRGMRPEVISSLYGADIEVGWHWCWVFTILK